MTFEEYFQLRELANPNIQGPEATTAAMSQQISSALDKLNQASKAPPGTSKQRLYQQGEEEASKVTDVDIQALQKKLQDRLTQLQQGAGKTGALSTGTGTVQPTTGQQVPTV